MKTNRPKPLQGIRIIALEQYGAGPFCTMNLADMGAEIIKIESPARPGIPGGDSSRQSGPYFMGEDDSQFFQTFNRNKRSMSLNTRSPEGREILLKLVATADAVINNLRGDQPAKLGITYDDLKHVNPRIVCAHLSGYGRTGPRATWPAYDYLMQAESGYLNLTGEPGSPPTRMGLSIVDFLTGITTAFATTAAMLGASRSGVGCDIDVTLYDVAMQQLTYPATWYLNEQHLTERMPRSGHPFVVPCEMFPTTDGSLFVMCITKKFWENFCNQLERPDLIIDPRFADFDDRLANRDALAKIIDAITSTKSASEWMQILAGKVPAAPVLTMPQALDNPYFKETGGITQQAHPLRSDFKVVSSPIRINGERSPALAGPALGADTTELLNELGIDSNDISKLHDQGVI